jgi:hypothetical protein
MKLFRLIGVVVFLSKFKLMMSRKNQAILKMFSDQNKIHMVPLLSYEDALEF